MCSSITALCYKVMFNTVPLHTLSTNAHQQMSVDNAVIIISDLRPDLAQYSTRRTEKESPTTMACVTPLRGYNDTFYYGHLQRFHSFSHSIYILLCLFPFPSRLVASPPLLAQTLFFRTYLNLRLRVPSSLSSLLAARRYATHISMFPLAVLTSSLLAARRIYLVPVLFSECLAVRPRRAYTFF